MREFDIVFIHPPAIYDFRKKAILPGPIARTVPIYTHMFIMLPIGMISMASYLEERGLKVRVFNLAEKMLIEKTLDVEAFLGGLKSRIYAIDLHWCVHSQGAIEIARICKALHPDSVVVLGGLTATCFAEEIAREFSFIDVVVKGEAEYALHDLFLNLEKYGRKEAFKKTPNLTFRDSDGRIISTNMRDVVSTLDQFEFTRLDLVEPITRTLTSPFTGSKLWNLPVCRGCTENCVTCGGSKLSYLRLLNRDTPAFRSPQRLLEDFMKLDELGVKSIFLFQDPRIGGETYVNELLKTFKGMKWSNIRNVGIELFWPASRSYLESLKKSNIAENVGLSISPESAVDYIRFAHGRCYSTSDLMKTIIYSKELNIPIGVFFMLCLAHETHETIRDAWLLWEKILSLNFIQCKTSSKISVDFGPMILLDPGSKAFFYPEAHGYKILFNNFLELYKNLNNFHWKFWINYETFNMNKSEIGRVILDSWEALSTIRWKLGFLTDREYELEMLRIKFEKTIFKKIDEVVFRRPEESEEIAKELVEISRDPFLTWSYIITEEDL